MATTEKKAPRITKANRLTDIKTLLTGKGEIKYGTTVDDAIAFIDKELDLLNRKNSKTTDGKPTKAQEENQRYKDLIINFLAGTPNGATCSDMKKGIPLFEEKDFNTSKISSLTSALVKEGRIERLKPVKGRTPFILV